MSNVNNFTLGTVLGWILGNVPALLAIPGKKIDDAIKASKGSLDTLDRPTIKVRKTELRKQLLSFRMIVMSLINLSVLLVLVLSICLGPPRLFGRFVPDAVTWTLGTTDKLVLGMVILIHVLLFLTQGASSWGSGVKQWVIVRKWLSEHRN